MKQKPSFQLYQQDFLGSLDVQLMTTEEVGCYFLMLCNIYNNDGKIPKDPDALKIICKGVMPTHRVLKKFYEDGEHFRNKRCDLELEKISKFSRSMKAAAKKRWLEAPKTPMRRHSVGNAKAMRRQCSSTLSLSSTLSSNNSNIVEPKVKKNDIEAVFSHFCEITQQKLVLNDKKTQQIKARLKSFSVEEIKTAIENRKTNPWHAGENSEGKLWYKNWDSLFRNDEKVEYAINLTASQKVEQKELTEEERLAYINKQFND